MVILILSIMFILVSIAGIVLGLYWARAYKIERNLIQNGDLKYHTIERHYSWYAFGGSGVLAIVSIGMWLFGCLYTQDPGQASVLVSFTGEVKGINYEPGLHFKMPWINRVEYDIRNNTLSYIGESGNTDSYTGGDVSGPQITFQDKNGVTGNIDLNVRYSVRGDAVGEIYNEYKTQQEFVNATLAPDVRATTREVLSQYDTSQVYNGRDIIKAKLSEVLQKNWDGLSVDIEDIYLQEVRYPSSVVEAFANAQSAKAKVEMAKADQERARVEAETNLIKSQALTESVLKEKLIEAIRYGTGTYVIDVDRIGIVAK